MIYVAIIFAAIGYLSFKPLIRKGLKKDLVIAAVFFVIAFTLAMLVAGGVHVPSPMMMLDSLTKKLGLSYPPA